MSALGDMIRNYEERITKLETALKRITNLHGNPYNPQEAVIIAREAQSIAKQVLPE